MPRYDFTISYANHEKAQEWRDWVLWHLEDDGYAIDWNTNVAGSSRVGSFEQVVDETFRFVIILSQGYLTSKDPIITLLREGLKTEQRQHVLARFLIVKTDKCNASWIDKFYYRVDLSDFNEDLADQARDALLNAARTIRAL